MELPKHVTEMSNYVEDLCRKPTSVSAKKVEQMYPSTTHQLELWILHKLHKIVFQSLFQARLWEGSEIILCAGFCLLLSLSLPFTWNNELQPLAILKCNHCDGILGAMSILQIHKKCTPSGGCLPATESVFGHIGGNRAQLGCSLQKVLQKHNF